VLAVELSVKRASRKLPDVFQYNEVLVVSDGTDALLGSLSADSERFMAWRTIDGVTVDRPARYGVAGADHWQR